MLARLQRMATKVRQKGLAGGFLSVARRLRHYFLVARIRLASAGRTIRKTLGQARRRAAATGFALAVLMCRALRIRFLVNPVFPVSFSRLGHLAAEPDCFIKEGLLGLRPRYRGVILFPRDRVANRCLLDYWRQYLWVFTLTLPEILNGPLGNARFSHCIDLARVRMEDNATEDIRDLALEMLDELDGTISETEEDTRLEAAYRALLRPGHYTFGAISRFGRVFLRKHRWLLDVSSGCATRRQEDAPLCGTTQCPCLRDTTWATQQLRNAS